MKITIMAVGRTTTPYIAKATDDYIGRACHYMPVEMLTVADIRQTRSLTMQQQRDKEGEQLLQAFQPSDMVVLLDEHGREMTSRQFAGYIERQAVSGRRRLVFVIGGPYGFSDAVRSRADAMISLSQMTFSHEMVRLFFAEQIYRAMTILRGEPYHHD
ncbi:23S rRNA (pseudouridine(1915)-N(3))-methyltransferase RlmH [Paramuribaculum intestinale]|uniref:23S rRNA (pseudouridine(1915)-N(3))-methyltransferase RlmH n=1 Tax=Paramuribaculum intestinale TaxID=2094151 RepID=UPI0023C02C78|nr:23S rRNA (pseudouridine(1915)-N(3))-methyltransferase RlmH [Paramuribaculum intestinale]MDE6524400.1 23S rRNA (pseudouridine(1915)-N(3))-methyltransferase RlmH [Paramuribaculum sp.]